MNSTVAFNLTTKESWRVETDPDFVLIAVTNVLSPTAFNLNLPSREQPAGLLEPSPDTALSSSKPSGTTGTLEGSACRGLPRDKRHACTVRFERRGPPACGNLSPSLPPRVT